MSKSLDESLKALTAKTVDAQREIRIAMLSPSLNLGRHRQLVLACYGVSWEISERHRIDPPDEPILDSPESCIQALAKLLGWINRANQSANFSALFPQGVPGDSDIVDLVLRLQAGKQSGQSMNAIARKFTGETSADCTKAKRLLARIRKMRKQGRIVF